MIPRHLYSPVFEDFLEGKKIVILYGPRQAGKTTLISEVLKNSEIKTLSINADQSRYIDTFSSRDLAQMKSLIEGYDALFIDEAQRIPDIGINLKILHDGWPELRIIATGSSSFELASKVKEPLTGRTSSYMLHPVGWTELLEDHTPFELDQRLEEFMLLGMYPERLGIQDRKKSIRYLMELTSSYLFKDVLELSSIRYSGKIQQLLQLLAFQIGSEISLSEIGQKLEMDKATVASYIDLLEQAFVIFRLSGYSRNLRKEVTKMDKIYFWDLGVRNAIIDQFQPLAMRNDTGHLWENFLIAERRKMLNSTLRRGRGYFWRTYNNAEVDYLEEVDGKLSSFELKWNNKTPKAPLAFRNAYPEASYSVVNRKNYSEFLRG